jgi:hypothetical protein
MSAAFASSGEAALKLRFNGFGVAVDADIKRGEPLHAQGGPAAQERLDIDAVRRHQTDDGLIDAFEALSSGVVDGVYARREWRGRQAQKGGP